MRMTSIRSLFATALIAAASITTAPSASAQPAPPPAPPAPASVAGSAEAALDRGEYASAEKLIAALKGADAAKGKLLQARLELRTGRYDKAIETAKAAAAGGKEAKIAA